MTQERKIDLIFYIFIGILFVWSLYSSYTRVEEKEEMKARLLMLEERVDHNERLWREQQHQINIIQYKVNQQ